MQHGATLRLTTAPGYVTVVLIFSVLILSHMIRGFSVSETSSSIDCTSQLYRGMALESEVIFIIGGSPALPVSHGSTVAETRGCEQRWRGPEGLWRRTWHSEIISDVDQQLQRIGRFDSSQPPLWLGSRGARTGRTGGQRAPKDATCNMLHSCCLKPKKDKLSIGVDYARRERLVRVETEKTDQG